MKTSSYSNGYSNGYGGGGAGAGGYGNSNGYGGGYGGGGGGAGGAGGDRMGNLGAGLKTQHWGMLFGLECREPRADYDQIFPPYQNSKKRSIRKTIMFAPDLTAKSTPFVVRKRSPSRARTYLSP